MLRTSDFKIFNELRLEDKLCDVIIEVDHYEFKAHKAVLCACSSYFCSLFCSTKGRRYQIPGVLPDIMRLIIEYIYTRSVPVSEDNVENLLKASIKFCVVGVTRACFEFLEVHLTSQNCIGSWKVADVYSSPKLRYHSYRFILHNFVHIAQTSMEFLELSCTELHDIIDEDELNVRVENAVFESIMRWIGHRPSERSQLISCLLPKVRMGLMDGSYFVDNVKNNTLVKGREECSTITLEGMKALDFHMNPSHLSASSSLSRPRLPPAFLLAIAGWSTSVPINGIESYDVRADRWVNVTPEGQSPRVYYGAVYHGGFVYCLGGYSSMGRFSSTRKFDPAKLAWQELGPMHCSRSYLSVAVLDGYIYAMGGADGQDYLDSAERYKPETNQWSLISCMHVQRSEASATALHGKVYICGGFNGQGSLFTAEFYSPNSDQWTGITPMSSRRSGLGVIAYGLKVYVVGGFDGVSWLRSAAAFDPLTDSWREVQDMITPRSNFGIEVLDERLFAVGGFNSTGTTDYAECYDATADQWSVVRGMELSRSALSCCVVPNLAGLSHYAAPRAIAGPPAELPVAPDDPASARP